MIKNGSTDISKNCNVDSTTLVHDQMYRAKTVVLKTAKNGLIDFDSESVVRRNGSDSLTNINRYISACMYSVY